MASLLPMMLIQANCSGASIPYRKAVNLEMTLGRVIHGKEVEVQHGSQDRSIPSRAWSIGEWEILGRPTLVTFVWVTISTHAA